MDKTDTKTNRKKLIFSVSYSCVEEENYIMVKRQAYVAYTIIVERDDGKPMFLVENGETDFGFPAIKALKDQSGLSQIITELKKTLKDLDFDQVELSELTNLVIDEHRIPLFVLKYRCEECSPEDLLPEDSTLEWQISDNIFDVLSQYDISGVPLF